MAYHNNIIKKILSIDNKIVRCELGQKIIDNLSDTFSDVSIFNFIYEK